MTDEHDLDDVLVARDNNRVLATLRISEREDYYALVWLERDEAITYGPKTAEGHERLHGIAEFWMEGYTAGRNDEKEDLKMRMTDLLEKLQAGSLEV